MAFLAGRDGRAFARIDADDDYMEVFARGQVHHFQGSRQTIQVFGTENLALVIDQRKDDRLFAEVVAQFYGFSGFVTERSIQG